MSRSTRAKVLTLGLFTIGVAAIFLSDNQVIRTAGASASGPIAGVTGAPLETDCTLCHTAPTGKRGEFTINAPSFYTPGQTYQITVTHENADDVTPRTNWGFELTALTVEGQKPAGDVQPLPQTNLTQVIVGGPTGDRQYIEHTHDGAFEGQLGGASWTFNWVAPEKDLGPVRFYAAGNQANGDFDSTGDQIYLSQTTLTPSNCNYSLSSLGAFFSMAGGVGQVSLNANPGCAWTTVNDSNWITLTSSASGTGSDTVTFEVRENFTGSARSGRLTIAGITCTVVQDGGAEGCNYSLSSSAIAYLSSGGGGTITVTSESGCAWQAVSNASWVKITSGAQGIRNGAVTYTVETNPGPAGRSAILTIAGLRFRIKQVAP